MSEPQTKVLSYEALEQEIEMNQSGIHLMTSSYYDNTSLI